ncbi:hypothetical protein D3C81_1597250 [compost metagenome]
MVVTRKEQRTLGKWHLAAAVQAHKVLDDIGHTFAAENFLPQVGALVPGRVGRVASPVVMALVERQEEGRDTG